MKLRHATITTMTAADATIGRCSLVALHVPGSAGITTVTMLDGTDVKLAPAVGVTANYNFTPAIPIAFDNLIVDVTGTGSYSIVYIPSP